MLGGQEGAWIIKTFIDCVEESQLYHEGNRELWKVPGRRGAWSNTCYGSRQESSNSLFHFLKKKKRKE